MALNVISDVGFFKMEGKNNNYTTSALRTYIGEHSDNLYVVEFNAIYGGERLFFTNNSLTNMNYISRSLWDSRYPANQLLFKHFGIDSMTIDNICDKNIYYVVSNEKYFEAFRDYVAKRHADKEVLLVDTIDGNTYDSLVCQVASKT